MLWAYPRGSGISKDGETAVDVCAYAAQIAAQLGAHVIKVKPPKDFIEQAEAKKAFEKAGIPTKTLADRVKHVVQSAFNGKRIVIFSGGESKGAADAGGGQGHPRRRRLWLHHGSQLLPAAPRRGGQAVEGRDEGLRLSDPHRVTQR